MKDFKRNYSNQVKDLNVQNTMVPILNKIKKECFTDDYEASDIEAFGLLMSKYFKWDGYKIFKANCYALEDSNFHALQARLELEFEEWDIEEDQILGLDYCDKSHPIHY